VPPLTQAFSVYLAQKGEIMNKHNLIQLGAFAQKQFQMKDDFEIVEYPPEALPKIKIAIQSSFSTFAHGESQPIEFDIVEPQKVGVPVRGEFAWIAYSSRANTLIIVDAA
jgi:hypothetical protein